MPYIHMSKLLSRVQLFVTPWSIQSMEFSRPEHWSGEPFPSPGDLGNPGIKPRSPTLQADSLPAGSQWKLKSTGVGSLSLLQQIFPTQESNWGLLHGRQIFTNWATRTAWDRWQCYYPLSWMRKWGNWESWCDLSKITGQLSDKTKVWIMIVWF